VAVLPEYAVDFVFTWKAGSDPAYAPDALANMTGGNQLLIGVGWSMVVLMVKWAIAAIPAVIILIAIFALLGTVAGYVFGPGWHWYPWSKGTVTM